MKNFKKVIRIEIEANQIAQMLLDQMNPEFKHVEIVVESIIGASTDMSLSLLYNALNGHSAEINFKVGDCVLPEEFKAYGYWTQESISAGNSIRQQIESATVVEIDLYKEEKLKIEYMAPNSKGVLEKNSTWMSHRKCSKIVPEKNYELVA